MELKIENGRLWISTKGGIPGGRNCMGEGTCYGLNVCVPAPPPIHMLRPTPQCDDIWRRGLWKVIRSWEWNPHEWDYFPCKRRIQEISLSALHHVRLQWEDHCLQTRKLSYQTAGSTCPLVLDFPAFKTVRNKCLLCKPPVFAIAAQTD